MAVETRSPDLAIRIDGLDKRYRRSTAGHKLRTLKSALLERSLVGGLDPKDAISALEGITFDVARGEAVGLLGSNGSGKSTLLKIVAGILRPTSGKVEVNGRTAALIELGAGFHPEISGRENIYINGAVLGLKRREIDERYHAIVEFSGLADFIEEPVKNYSSGMYVRLGFAVAIHTDPEVLLVDEVLSVGDEAFAHRCLRRIEECLAEGRTLLLVSHSLGLIEEICDRAIWLEKGQLRFDGHPRRVTDAYRQAVAEEESEAHREAKERREGDTRTAAAPKDETSPEDGDPGDDPDAEVSLDEMRWGSGEARIREVEMWVGDEERYHLRTGESVRFRLLLEARRELTDFVFGIGLSTPRGVEIWGTNTDLAGFVPERLEAGAATVELHCPDLRLAPGEYLLDVAVHAKDGTPYDYRRRILSMSVIAAERGVGLYFPRHEWTFDGGISWGEADEPSKNPATEDSE